MLTFKNIVAGFIFVSLFQIPSVLPAAQKPTPDNEFLEVEINEEGQFKLSSKRGQTIDGKPRQPETFLEQIKPPISRIHSIQFADDGKSWIVRGTRRATPTDSKLPRIHDPKRGLDSMQSIVFRLRPEIEVQQFPASFATLDRSGSLLLLQTSEGEQLLNPDRQTETDIQSRQPPSHTWTGHRIDSFREPVCFDTHSQRVVIGSIVYGTRDGDMIQDLRTEWPESVVDLVASPDGEHYAFAIGENHFDRPYFGRAALYDFKSENCCRNTIARILIFVT